MANINEKIYIGSVDTPTLSFDQRSIEDIVCNNSVDLIGDELSSDVLEVSVFFDDADETLRNTAYGTPIFYYSNDYLVGKYYVSEIERRGLKRYLIRSTSLIGLIEKEDFYGGFYSGENFKDVVEDILLTNGINTTKYSLYYPLSHSDLSNHQITPAKVLNETIGTKQWKYRIYIDFVYIEQYGTSTQLNEIAGSVVGGSGYYVQAKVSVDKILTINLFYNSNWSFVSYTSPKFGVGSRVVVDINPIAKTYYIGVDYINPSDVTDVGHMERTGTFTASPGTRNLNMNYAYGATTTYSINIKWNAFKIYNDSGNIIIDAAFAQSIDGTKNYVINKANGLAVETSYFIPTGDQIGMIGNFERLERDVELTKSIIYGNNTENIEVYGWIGAGTRREALHYLLFSYNVCMLKSDIGGILFTTLSTNTIGNIAENDIYDDSKEKSMSVAKIINVTEHSYEQSNNSQVLFDNSNNPLTEGQYIALFEKSPIYGSVVGNGITILYNNCNAAIVTGRGTITGTPYTHSKNVISYNNGNALDGSDISINNVGLITVRNSDYVMNKLKAYYSGVTKKISNSIKYNGEKCGLKYLFKTLYSETNNSFLTSINSISSSFVKAKCEFVSGYIPPAGSGYTNYEIITYDEQWVVPDEIKTQEYPTIRLNIIGKGHNGTAGMTGSAGSKAQTGSGPVKQGGAGGAGGAGGIGGDGGDIYSITVDVTNISYITVSNSGYNTIVKTYNNSTLINTYSSGFGNKSQSGFLNVFTGIYYARKGIDGYSGGNGGNGGSAGPSKQSGETKLDVIDPEPGEDVDIYNGGISFDFEAYVTDGIYYYNSYGGGGGAAYGQNGNNSIRNNRMGDIVLTTGGIGANAIIPQNPYTEYGSGGFGGNGGGGGGGAGIYFRWLSDGSGSIDGETFSQNNGAGGYGSDGTPGINGCVIIYY